MPLPMGEVAQGQREVSFADLSDLSDGEGVFEMTMCMERFSRSANYTSSASLRSAPSPQGEGFSCVKGGLQKCAQTTDYKTKLPLAQQLCKMITQPSIFR